jgi:RNA polymerase sigma-70 factor (ECF subfamily)
MNRSHEPTDAELLARSRDGDEAAFLELYRRTQGPVFRFAMQMSGSRSIAEDVTQEVFLALARDGGRFDPARGSLQSYLFGMTRNQVLRRFDKRATLVSIDEERDGADPLGSVEATADQHGELARAQTVEIVRRAVQSLPVNYREVVVLCDLQELSYEDAAAALECAVGTVRSRLHRARAMLAERLQFVRESSPEASRSATTRYVV